MERRSRFRLAFTTIRCSSGDRRFAAKLVGATEGGHQGVLKGIGGFVGVAGCAKRHCPESITVACDQCSKALNPSIWALSSSLSVGGVSNGVAAVAGGTDSFDGFEPTDRRRSPGRDRRWTPGGSPLVARRVARRRFRDYGQPVGQMSTADPSPIAASAG